jgi:hypothetical protein
MKRLCLRRRYASEVRPVGHVSRATWGRGRAYNAGRGYMRSTIAKFAKSLILEMPARAPSLPPLRHVQFENAGHHHGRMRRAAFEHRELQSCDAAGKNPPYLPCGPWTTQLPLPSLPIRHIDRSGEWIGLDCPMTRPPQSTNDRMCGLVRRDSIGKAPRGCKDGIKSG